MSGSAARSARRSSRAAVLPSEFYGRDTEIVARELLGCILECRTAEGVAAGRIVETEAYVGEHDLACHAAAGRTRRTEPLYGPPGIAYVYFIYGVHWCFNAVTRDQGLPSAVLVRAIEPLVGLSVMRRRRQAARRDVDLTNGPGKLCAALGIDGRHNALALQRPPIVIRRGDAVGDDDVLITPRIGISQSAEWPLRWIVASSPYVSRTPASFPRVLAADMAKQKPGVVNRRRVNA
ncbi:MAG TPA: DNA-3-methyladenine glycosylase [Gemmatimonadaceae bacterium]|nr:DNA-3-methyladenine glycosylase [Gemmatimonadaceae bacterium]